MLSLIDEKSQQIAELCRKFGVVRLELFGSGARDDFDPATSDLDFFVEFADTNWKGSFRRFMGLKLGLEDLFGRQIDLIEPRAVTNPVFGQIARQHRSLVYAA